MKAKLKVAVLYGGPSSEHEVSLRSGAAILANMPAHYEVLPVEISTSNIWHFKTLDLSLPLDKALPKLASLCDIAILGVHGTFGEDGTLQALLETNNIPHTGASAAASILAFDKAMTAAVYDIALLPQPETIVVSSIEELKDLKLPLVIKPARQGSSVGVSIVKQPEQLQPAYDLALLHDTKVLAQAFIAGVEVSCGVIEIDGVATALMPTELIAKKGEFFDYESKYSEGGAEELTPPKHVASDHIKTIQAYAVRAHAALGCRGYSRTDMIVAENGIYLIETNTLPGLSEASILPKQLAHADISFTQMLEYIVTATLAQRAV